MDERTFSAKRAEPSDSSLEHEFAQLLTTGIGSISADRQRIDGVRVGKLIGFTVDDHTPLVLYEGQPGTAALPARATVDLHAAHIGHPVTLLFEQADPNLPIIVGCLRTSHATALAGLPGHIEVDADGRHLVVSASEQIVLRCGKASITLTKEGKLLIQGAYVSNQSSGVLRIKGGSVQIN
jgi:Domain of unknown function (DUF6484)